MEEQTPKKPEDSTEEQPSVLLDVADMSGYDKSIKNARIWLYVLCALQIGMGIYEYFQYQGYGAETAWLAFGIDAGIGLAFLACALWSYKKAAVAFMTALIVYIVVHILSAFIDPTNLIRGVLIKVLVIIALIKAYKDAKESEELKKTFSGGIE